MTKAYVEATLGRSIPDAFMARLLSITDHRKLVKWALEDALWDWLGEK